MFIVLEKDIEQRPERLSQRTKKSSKVHTTTLEENALLIDNAIVVPQASQWPTKLFCPSTMTFFGSFVRELIMAWGLSSHPYFLETAPLPLDPSELAVPEIPPASYQSRLLDTQPDLSHTRSPTHLCQDGAIATVPSSAMARDRKLPKIGLLLIDATCDLCGNSFDIESSKPTRLPCVDRECDPCARMWRILSSPTCPACYQTSHSPLSFQDKYVAFYGCPKLPGNRAELSSSPLDLDANEISQQPPPSDSNIGSSLSFQDKYVAFYGIDADSDEDTISNPGSPMKDEEDGITAVSQLGDEALREALILANNRVGTNFNIQEIVDEIPLTVLRAGTKTQLEDTLTQLCTAKAFEGEDVDVEDEDLQHLDEGELSGSMSQQDEETSQENENCCIHCSKAFRTAGHLRQHMVVHNTERCACSICNQILGNPASRRAHEKKHWETDSQREERLQKAQVARDQLRGRQGAKRIRRGRVPKILT